jgi:hypothetical protein
LSLIVETVGVVILRRLFNVFPAVPLAKFSSGFTPPLVNPDDFTQLWVILFCMVDCLVMMVLGILLDTNLTITEATICSQIVRKRMIRYLQ